MYVVSVRQQSRSQGYFGRPDGTATGSIDADCEASLLSGVHSTVRRLLKTADKKVKVADSIAMRLPKWRANQSHLKEEGSFVKNSGIWFDTHASKPRNNELLRSVQIHQRWVLVLQSAHP